MASLSEQPQLNFDPQKLPRELKRHYISASDQEISEMLAAIGVETLEDLFEHIDAQVKFKAPLGLPEELDYSGLQDALFKLSCKNKPTLSFIGDGLPQYRVPEISDYVANIRKLTTSYTPYQPERSQGTLITHWIYQCVMSMLTGFEAVNSSLYDRSTAIFEAASAILRLQRKADTVLIAEAIYPGDRQVVETLASDTSVKIEWIPACASTGSIDLDWLKQRIQNLGTQLGGIIFPQTNNLGILEPVDALADLARENKLKSVAIIDPILLAQGGLKPPSEYGSEGVDMIVGEAQHLGLGPSFGGPGLGMFGVRLNSKARNDIRQSPGRFVGRAKDSSDRDCQVMVLSTREQHIRKEKATSNICSNQAYIATIVGAAILQRGETGMSVSCQAGRDAARKAAAQLTALPGIQLAYPDTPFYNEFTLKVESESTQLLEQLRANPHIHAGVDVSDRLPHTAGCSFIKLSFSDLHGEAEVAQLVAAFSGALDCIPAGESTIPEIPATALREGKVGLPEYPLEDIKAYYDKLGELNISPDETLYPLGSCTMKYNPFINDWAASLPGFTDIHPQAPLDDAQGCLELLFETQEWFKKITGLAGVTTQPVAGAQGELVGLKLFQAYHRSRGDEQRDVVIIPRSAHGTNFATATMAGYSTRKVDGRNTGIIYLEADATGQVDMNSLDEVLQQQGDHIAGIMVTNPNTGGVFESRFKEMADKVHAAGGLVYMDGANMNAIAGWVDLGALGVDAIHNNLHKTWTIPHGGGGPGDAIVAVSEKLVDFLPGCQIIKEDGQYKPLTPSKSIGSFHRHWGNFAHKIRCYTYLLRLGETGVRRMSAVSVLASRYLFKLLGSHFPCLPEGSADVPRMHEFILTLDDKDFENLENAGVPKSAAIPRVGKLFLDFGFHAPTVAFPEVYGLMIEPTESYTKAELDRFANAVLHILKIIHEKPEVLQNVPLFTPVDRVDEVSANRNPQLFEPLTQLPELPTNRVIAAELQAMAIEDIYQKILDN